MSPNTERTFIMIKPDAVQVRGFHPFLCHCVCLQRGLVGEIIKRFEQRGFRLIAMKFMHASKAHLEVR